MHGAGGPAGGFGDVAAAGQVQGADGEVAHAGHNPGSGVGAGSGVVFAVDGVAQPVQRFDAPMVADECGGSGLVGAQVGDARARRLLRLVIRRNR